MWTLLSNTRRKCWNSWLAISPLITLTVLAQTVGGTLDNIAGTAWTWFILTVVPGFLLLFVSVVQHHKPAKLVPLHIHRALWLGTVFYLLLVMVTLLTEPVALENGISIKRFLILSYWWLLPFEAILIAGLLLAFFRQEALYQPDNRAIVELSMQYSAQWKAKGVDKRQRCFDLIATDELQGACDLIRAENESFADMAATLRGRCVAVQNGLDMHTLDPNEARRELNRVAVALIDLADRF